MYQIYVSAQEKSGIEHIHIPLLFFTSKLLGKVSRKKVQQMTDIMLFVILCGHAKCLENFCKS